MRVVVDITDDGEYITAEDFGLCAAANRICTKAVIRAYKIKRYLCNLCKLKKEFPHGARK